MTQISWLLSRLLVKASLADHEASCTRQLGRRRSHLQQTLRAAVAPAGPASVPVIGRNACDRPAPDGNRQLLSQAESMSESSDWRELDQVKPRDRFSNPRCYGCQTDG